MSIGKDLDPQNWHGFGYLQCEVENWFYLSEPLLCRAAWFLPSWERFSFQTVLAENSLITLSMIGLIKDKSFSGYNFVEVKFVPVRIVAEQWLFLPQWRRPGCSTCTLLLSSSTSSSTSSSSSSNHQGLISPVGPSSSSPPENFNIYPCSLSHPSHHHHNHFFAIVHHIHKSYWWSPP